MLYSLGASSGWDPKTVCFDGVPARKRNVFLILSIYCPLLEIRFKRRHSNLSGPQQSILAPNMWVASVKMILPGKLIIGAYKLGNTGNRCNSCGSIFNRFLKKCLKIKNGDCFSKEISSQRE